MKTAAAMIIACTIWAGAQAQAPKAQALDSSTQVIAKFAKPPAAYSTLPFFVWNGELSEKEIDRVISDYASQNVQGFFIHPRPGLITPYLSERWFQLIRYTVDQAKKRGMVVWLYDENSYPSGFAGGHVPAEMPESYNQGQGLVVRESGPCHILLRRTAAGFEDVTGKAQPGPGTTSTSRLRRSCCTSLNSPTPSVARST